MKKTSEPKGASKTTASPVTVARPDKGTSTQSSTPAMSPAFKALHVRPWVRFFARNLDLILFSFFAGLIIALIKPVYVLNAGFWFTLVIFFLWFMVEPILLCTIGTTFGKWLLKVEVRDTNQTKPTYKEALQRSFMVWSVGYAVGLPIISLGTLAMGYYKLVTTGTTYWDKDRFVITHGTIGYVRAGVAIAIFALVFGLGIYSTIESVMRFSTTAVTHDVDEINKELPTMVDKDTELTKVSLDDSVVNYNYKLVNTQVKQLDIPTFTDAMRSLIVKQVCNNLYSLQLLENGYTISFNYVDKDSADVAKIPLVASDCHQ